MKDYIVPTWQAILDANQLGSFEQLWDVEAELVEPRNKRRGGWSGVSRLFVTMADGQQVTLFLKRQQNHNYKAIANLIRVVPTFRREMRNMKRFMRHGIPIAEPIYYAERKIDKQTRAILITASISPEYESLENLYTQWSETTFPPIQDRREIVKKIAYAVREIHKRFIRYGALHPKHVFIKYAPNEPISIRFIDLENARYWYLPVDGADKDLHFLHRGLRNLRAADVFYFYKCYKNVDRLKKHHLILLKQVSHRFKKWRKSKWKQ